MAVNLSQFFNVVISSPKNASKQVSLDVTKYIEVGVRIIDEDGMIKECGFEVTEGFLLMDILAIGMRVDLVGGNLNYNEPLFSGFIQTLEPEFKDGGDVRLKIQAYADEGSSLGVTIRDLIYPSKNHPDTWATSELMYSSIITNLAKKAGLVVENDKIKVLRDVKASFKQSVRQKGMTDWAFIQFLAMKINCTLWTEDRNGKTYLNLVDNKYVVNTLADHTFFFLPRVSGRDFLPYEKTSDKQIQVISAKVKLDTSQKGAFKQTVNPETGETTISTEIPAKNEAGEETGEVELWVLDEEKVRGLPTDERQNLINLFVAGKINWEGGNGMVAAKTYFKKVIMGASSREGTQNNITIEKMGGELKDDGVSSTDPTKENTGSRTYTTVIDTQKVNKLSPEERSKVQGRIARGEMTDEDRELYTVVDTTPKDKKDDAVASTGQAQNTDAGVDKTKKKVTTSSNKQKRDSGFNIECSVYGNLNIKPRLSYVVEGLGKYSGLYYLYKITHDFGKRGHIMTLIFTR